MAVSWLRFVVYVPVSKTQRSLNAWRPSQPPNTTSLSPTRHCAWPKRAEGPAVVLLTWLQHHVSASRQCMSLYSAPLAPRPPKTKMRPSSAVPLWP